MNEKQNGNGTNGLWKFIAVTTLGVLIGMAVQIFRQPADVVQEKELNLRLLELQQKIDTQTNEIVALRASVNQMSIDIAQIAVKTGTTAHPVVSPSH